jgi:hypothetical protein
VSRLAGIDFRRHRLEVMLAMVVVAVGLYSGCGGTKGPGAAPSQSPLDTYVGKVNGSNAYIAVITNGDRMSGFFTDGKSQAKWFATAKLEDGKAKLVARDGSPLGDVRISDQSASGEVTVGISTHTFDAKPATGEAGLFTAEEKRGRNSFEAGWIVLAPGSVLGTYDTYINGQFLTHPAPQLKSVVRIPMFGLQAPHQQPSLFLDTNVQAP